MNIRLVTNYPDLFVPWNSLCYELYIFPVFWHVYKWHIMEYVPENYISCTFFYCSTIVTQSIHNLYLLLVIVYFMYIITNTCPQLCMYHFAWADQRAKQGYNWGVSWESYAHDWWINLWSKSVAIPTHNVMSQLLHVLHTYKVIPGKCKYSTLKL